MPRLRFNITASLDGFVAGPAQSEQNPLGEGGEELHEWALELESWRRAHGKEGGETNASTAVMDRMSTGVGASIMGRNMFGPIRGDWDPENPWDGWWGEDPPFRCPVFVLTHYERETLTLGETTFHFATDGPAAALEEAREAAGELDVTIGGGAQTIQQYLAMGEVDEFTVSVAPLLLGDGARLFAGDLGDPLPRLRLVESIDAPGVTHLTYAVER